MMLTRSVREAYELCFGSVDDQTFHGFATTYFAGWLYVSVDGEFTLTSPIELHSLEEHFSYYAENIEVGDEWYSKFEAYCKSEGIFADTHRFVLDLPNVDLVIYESSVKSW